jgi:hypothetical protein
MPYLGIVTPLPLSLTTRVATEVEKRLVASLVPDFRTVFTRAKKDWRLLVDNWREFRPEQLQTALAWFEDFPRLWEVIRPNFIQTREGLKFGGQVDDWIGSIQKSRLYRTGGLGLAPIVVAGVFLVGGLAAGIWGAGFVKKQFNVSKMIEAVSTGTLDPGVLREAVKADRAGGLFAGVERMISVGLFGVAAWIVWKVVGKRSV